MPYYKKEDVNLLLLHIPKTGGSSLERYFSKKYRVRLCTQSLWGFASNDKGQRIRPSLQHLTYNEIVQNAESLGVKIDWHNLDLITAVRDPYDRCVSDLFFTKRITTDATPAEVFVALQRFVRDNPDSHAQPQYLFVTDPDGHLLPGLKVMNTETLNDDMIDLGYTDFDQEWNRNRHSVQYESYLNRDSIAFINEYYDTDFRLFNYDKRSPASVYEGFSGNMKYSHMQQSDMQSALRSMFLVVVCAVTLIVLDGAFLSLVKNLFDKQILSVQHSALRIDVYAAALCYVVLVGGLYYFIVQLNRSVAEAFGLGVVVYATFELTNKALLREWKWTTVAMDTTWGGTLFALTSWIVIQVSRLRLV